MIANSATAWKRRFSLRSTPSCQKLTAEEAYLASYPRLSS